MNNRYEIIANKILKFIKKKRYSKEILLSFDYEDLISNLYLKIKNEENFETIENEYYDVLVYIIDNCTNLDANDFTYLFYGGAATLEILITAIQYKTDFNFQMAQFFDETII